MENPSEAPRLSFAEVKTQAVEALRDPQAAFEKAMWGVRKKVFETGFKMAGFKDVEQAIAVVRYLEEKTTEPDYHNKK